MLDLSAENPLLHHQPDIRQPLYSGWQMDTEGGVGRKYFCTIHVPSLKSSYRPHPGLNFLDNILLNICQRHSPLRVYVHAYTYIMIYMYMYIKLHVDYERYMFIPVQIGPEIGPRVIESGLVVSIATVQCRPTASWHNDGRPHPPGHCLQMTLFGTSDFQSQLEPSNANRIDKTEKEDLLIVIWPL